MVNASAGHGGRRRPHRICEIDESAGQRDTCGELPPSTRYRPVLRPRRLTELDKRRTSSWSLARSASADGPLPGHVDSLEQGLEALECALGKQGKLLLLVAQEILGRLVMIESLLTEFARDALRDPEAGTD